MNVILDLLFPKRCVSCGKLGSYICKKCFSRIEFIKNPVCPVCQRQAVEGKTHPGCKGRYRLDGLVVAARYRGPVKTAIIKVKYKWIYDIEKIFVDLLSQRFWKFNLPAELILVPVPLYSQRKKWRGFNQAEILAKSLSLQFNVPYFDLMNRFIETKPQVGLSREDRKENVKGAFALRKIITRVNGKNIILVDDVFTTGATLQECAKVLKQAGAGLIWSLTVARER